MNKIIAQGAEAKITQINPNTLKKIREEKPYRIKEIDLTLRKSRCKKEFKILNYLKENKLNVPKPFELIINKNEISFTFELINAEILKQVIDKELLFKAFNQIIKLHQLEIIHGDLTTLNMLSKNKSVYLIDFGLAEFSKKQEDRAVDLNLFFTCIKNEHPKLYKYKKELIENYKILEFSKMVIQRLEKIEKRGRNK